MALNTSVGSAHLSARPRLPPAPLPEPLPSRAAALPWRDSVLVLMKWERAMTFLLVPFPLT